MPRNEEKPQGKEYELMPQTDLFFTFPLITFVSMFASTLISCFVPLITFPSLPLSLVSADYRQSGPTIYDQGESDTAEKHACNVCNVIQCIGLISFSGSRNLVKKQHNKHFLEFDVCSEK